MGFEPTAFWLGTKCSTPELHPHGVGEEGGPRGVLPSLIMAHHFHDQGTALAPRIAPDCSVDETEPSP